MTGVRGTQYREEICANPQTKFEGQRLTVPCKSEPAGSAFGQAHETVVSGVMWLPWDRRMPWMSTGTRSAPLGFSSSPTEPTPVIAPCAPTRCHESDDRGEAARVAGGPRRVTPGDCWVRSSQRFIAEIPEEVPPAVPIVRGNAGVALRSHLQMPRSPVVALDQ